MDYRFQYKEAIATYLDLSPQQITLFWKGRVGLYGILKALDIGLEDEVIIPAFTCVVVPNAIKYLGAKPIYTEIDPQTYNLDCQKLAKQITPKTKLIIAQNTFGLSSDFDAIQEIAAQHQIKVIEDCTHGFGGFYKGKKNGSLASAAFYSTQWNKPFSTGLGGIVVCQDKALAEKLLAFEASLSLPSFGTREMLRLQLFVRTHLLHPSIYWTAIRLYRFLSKHNIITGSSQGAELENAEMPEGYLLGMTLIQAKKGIAALESFSKNLAHRQNIAQIYEAALKRLEVAPIKVPHYAQHTYLKYPILVKDRTSFLQQAEKENIQLGDWFLSPIHPIEKNFELWDYPYGQFPIAEKISQHIVNLPTEIDITNADAKRIVHFLERHRQALWVGEIV